MGGAIGSPSRAAAAEVSSKSQGRPGTVSGSLQDFTFTPSSGDGVPPTQAQKSESARKRSRRAGRPLLGPGGAQRDEGLQTTLGAG